MEFIQGVENSDSNHRETGPSKDNWEVPSFAPPEKLLDIHPLMETVLGGLRCPVKNLWQRSGAEALLP